MSDVYNLYKQRLAEKKDLELLDALFEGIEDLEENAPTIPAKVDALSKIQMVKKLASITNFSEKFLRKLDEPTLANILKAFMSIGRARMMGDLRKNMD